MTIRSLAALAGLLLVAATLQGGAVAVDGVSLTSHERFVVGFQPGELDAATALIGATGATVLRSSDAIGVSIVHGPGSALLDLAGSSVIDFVESEGSTRAAGTDWDGTDWDGTDWDGTDWDGTPSSDPGLPGQWGLERIGAGVAWSSTMGSGAATLCVADSGVDTTHPDIAANLWQDPVTGAHGWNAVDGSSDVTDAAGHGTHVAGIAAGVVDNDHGIAGVGNVQIMPVKVLSDDGTGKEGDLALGIAWCVEHGADVILLALSSDNMGSGLSRAIKYADAQDVVVVSSAGNTGSCTSCVSQPASHKHVIAVAATDDTDAKASFSSSGPQVALAAPGVGILGPTPDGTFTYGSGTSQAAAFVAGTAALVRDANPGLTDSETRALLEGTAEDLGPAGHDSTFGHGLVNAGAALAAAGGA